MPRFKVGVQLQPQHCTVDQLRRAWRAADRLGVDSVWTWDHFFPINGPADGAHFEGWTLLAAMAVETERAQFGAMVACNSYRNPDLAADMARTIDHLGGGRHVLGIGAGWFERDYREYGYEFGTAATRLRALRDALPRIKARLARLTPGPAGPLPILIGGSGEKVTLRLVAEHADMWNSFGPPERYAHKSRVLDEWCERVGRDAATVERTINIPASAVGQAEAYVEAGATHLILGTRAPFDLEPAEHLLQLARSQPSGRP